MNAYASHYSRRASALREYMRVRAGDLNPNGLMLIAMSIRAMTTERGPVTPLRDVLAQVGVR